MAANDKSRKSTQRRASGSRSSSAGAGARKSSSRSRSGGEDDTRRGGKAATGSTRQAGEGGGSRSGSGRKSAAKKSSSRDSGARKSASRDSGRAQSGSRGRKSAGTARGRMDALKLLKEDHDRVDEMFKRYDRMKEGDERKQQLLQTILEEVRVHAQVEEELFYPALTALFEEAGKDKERELIEEADVEHETVKWLMEQLEGEQSDEGMRDARVKVMGEYIRHHVEEEEGQIFKAAKKVDLDLEELGRQMDARKRQLKGEEPADQEGAGDGDMQVSEPAQMATSGSRTH
jgi:hemerythrin superfamily protein